MTVPDLIFVSLVLGLPIVVSLQLFQREPRGRPLLATFALAVLGSSLLFTMAALILALAGVAGLTPFDGIFELIVSVPIALMIGLAFRRRRTRAAL